tara:strand:- start:15039 stop:15230 length:192 start_codon:yes stop_codon:yes gene_type:complete
MIKTILSTFLFMSITYSTPVEIVEKDGTVIVAEVKKKKKKGKKIIKKGSKKKKGFFSKVFGSK